VVTAGNEAPATPTTRQSRSDWSVCPFASTSASLAGELSSRLPFVRSVNDLDVARRFRNPCASSTLNDVGDDAAEMFNRSSGVTMLAN